MDKNSRLERWGSENNKQLKLSLVSELFIDRVLEQSGIAKSCSHISSILSARKSFVLKAHNHLEMQFKGVLSVSTDPHESEFQFEVKGAQKDVEGVEANP